MKQQIAAALALATLTATSTAAAAVIQFQLSTQIIVANANDNTPVATSLPPFATLTFSDTAPGNVQLVISADFESSTDFVSQLGFNLNPAFNPAQVVFAQAATSGSFNAPVLNAGTDNQTLTGAGAPAISVGTFDFRLDFTTNTVAGRFDGFDSLTYNLSCPVGPTCLGALDATDFDFVNGGTYPGYYAAAKLGYSGTPVDSNAARYGDNIGADNTIQQVSEPGTVGVLALGLIALAWSQRRHTR